MDIVKIAYERYKLDWMIGHGHTLEELMCHLDMMQEEEDSTTVSSLYNDWEYGFGFGSEIWACLDEFMEYEFSDQEYMKLLLTEDQWEEYLEYVQKQKEEADE